MIFEKEGITLRPQEFVNLTKAPFDGRPFFGALLPDITSCCIKLYKKGELTRRQLWLGAYYKKELLEAPLPDVAIRWIDPSIGWGVFALRPFKKGEFIAEYGGEVRKRRRSDSKNSYCFEYVIAQGHETPYNIDAEGRGGVARYINHSPQPNLESTLATLGFISHVILIVKEPIALGEQLSYDYGSTYWKRRPAPSHLSGMIAQPIK